MSDKFTNRVEALRHFKVFDPIAFGYQQIDIVGCGAIGSKIALSIAKLGVQNLHVYDFDKVADHNIGNQAFFLEHIGATKVDAVEDICRRATGLVVSKHNEKVSSSTQFGDIVFMCVDSMKVREEILDAVAYKLTTKQVFDTRMGVDVMRIYTVDPNEAGHIEKYKETIVSDEVAEESYCGSKTSVGMTSGIVSEMAVWQFVKWANRIKPASEEKEAKERDNSAINEIIYATRPEYLGKRKF